MTGLGSEVGLSLLFDSDRILATRWQAATHPDPDPDPDMDLDSKRNPRSFKIAVHGLI